MLSQGASPQEVRGVLGSARKHAAGHWDGQIDMLPVQIRAARVGSERVWLFGHGWGVNDKSFPDEPPTHICVVIIGVRPPYVIGPYDCCR